MKRFYVLLLLAALTSAAYAHQDQLLEVQPDGSLPEIPEEFGAVYFRVSELDAEPVIEFTTGDHRNFLPPCITQHIKTKTPREISLSASWYHSESVLPYYVSAVFYDPGYDPRRSYNSSLNILFNLRTAQVIQIQRFVAKHADDGGQYQDVVLSEGCRGPAARPN
jgi:hypothetical protein